MVVYGRFLGKNIKKSSGKVCITIFLITYPLEKADTYIFLYFCVYITTQLQYNYNMRELEQESSVYYLLYCGSPPNKAQNILCNVYVKSLSMIFVRAVLTNWCEMNVRYDTMIKKVAGSM